MYRGFESCSRQLKIGKCFECFDLHFYVYMYMYMYNSWALQLFCWDLYTLGLQLTYKPHSYRSTFCLATSRKWVYMHCTLYVYIYYREGGEKIEEGEGGWEGGRRRRGDCI